ncbi:hypothetical protein [Bacteroides sp. BFG-606]|uniref:hypothetical protein n=1 Tax=Bacteroides sp. BFG-606 TaxID=2972763 RepID=UPI0021662399|nr:hypothetical protein [Bacteroides sp. BFG-606]MCS2335390.1 hypothetical protein [Bacteroides sp. BFG-606]
MTLPERLMKLTEEKTKLECENQKLRDNCIAWQSACKLRDKCINDLLESKEKYFNEKHQYFMENIELKAYNQSAKIVLKRCGSFLSKHRKAFGIADFFIKDLGLDLIVEEREERLQQVKKEPEKDDIIDLFKQSSK